MPSPPDIARPTHKARMVIACAAVIGAIGVWMCAMGRDVLPSDITLPSGNRGMGQPHLDSRATSDHRIATRTARPNYYINVEWQLASERNLERLSVWPDSPGSTPCAIRTVENRIVIPEPPYASHLLVRDNALDLVIGRFECPSSAMPEECIGTVSVPSLRVAYELRFSRPDDKAIGPQWFELRVQPIEADTQAVARRAVCCDAAGVVADVWLDRGKRYSLIHKEGYALDENATIQVPFKSPLLITRQITLTIPLTSNRIVGTVVDDAGSPVAGLSIVGHGTAIDTTTSASDGSFELIRQRNGAEAVRILVGPAREGPNSLKRPTYEGAEAPGMVAWGRTDVRIIVKRRLWIRVSLVEKGTGKRVESYDLLIACANARRETGLIQVRQATVEPYRVEGVAQGRNVLCAYSTGDNKRLIAGPTAIDIQMQGQEVMVECNEDRELSIAVVEQATQQRISMAEVRAFGSDGFCQLGLDMVAHGAIPVEGMFRDGSGVPVLYGAAITNSRGVATVRIPSSLDKVVLMVRVNDVARAGMLVENVVSRQVIEVYVQATCDVHVRVVDPTIAREIAGDGWGIVLMSDAPGTRWPSALPLPPPTGNPANGDAEGRCVIAGVQPGVWIVHLTGPNIKNGYGLWQPPLGVVNVPRDQSTIQWECSAAKVLPGRLCIEAVRGDTGKDVTVAIVCERVGEGAAHSLYGGDYTIATRMRLHISEGSKEWKALVPAGAWKVRTKVISTDASVSSAIWSSYVTVTVNTAQDSKVVVDSDGRGVTVECQWVDGRPVHDRELAIVPRGSAEVGDGWVAIVPIRHGEAALQATGEGRYSVYLLPVNWREDQMNGLFNRRDGWVLSAADLFLEKSMKRQKIVCQ